MMGHEPVRSEHAAPVEQSPCGRRSSTENALCAATARLRDTGCYQVAFFLPAGMTLRIGALGKAAFCPGWYVYTGSARRALSARLRRHLVGAGTLRWHIDYLSSRIRPVAWRVLPLGQRTECRLAEEEAQRDGALRHPGGFGSSDCGCGGHLAYSNEPPSWITARCAP